MNIIQEDYYPIKFGWVNCYLIKTEGGYILIDTGFPRKRKQLEKALEEVGCSSSNLKLIIATHGDFDHTGNCDYLREKYKTKIAMHAHDSGMVEHGDMLWGRKMRNLFTRMILKVLLLLFRAGKFRKFKPDIFLEEGYDLSSFGLKAKVIHLPGHSKGSIGILTSSGNLFCGDLFMNTGKKPGKSSLVDNSIELDASVTKLKNYNFFNVYPGHGSSFKIEDYWKSH